jgi:hypothetical protein
MSLLELGIRSLTFRNVSATSAVHRTDICDTHVALCKEVFASFSPHTNGLIRIYDLKSALEECSKRLLATKGPSYDLAALLDFAVGYASRVGSRLAIWKDRGNKAPLEQLHLILLSFVGSFFGILILSYIDHVMVVDNPTWS